MKAVEETIGYVFSDQGLLKEALSHPSLSSEIRPAPPDNQRLEFLGDAVLELTVSDYLFGRFPESQEGPLTKLRASVVSKQGLARVARRLKLGESLFLSNGEESSGGRERASNLADAVEALLGAVFLDAGYEKVKELVEVLLGPEFDELDPKAAQAANSKGRLQEILQKITPEAPVYRVTEEVGPAHARVFSSEVIWCGKVLGAGSGPSKKVAETEAAAKALAGEGWK